LEREFGFVIFNEDSGVGELLKRIERICIGYYNLWVNLPQLVMSSYYAKCQYVHDAVVTIILGSHNLYIQYVHGNPFIRPIKLMKGIVIREMAHILGQG